MDQGVLWAVTIKHLTAAAAQFTLKLDPDIGGLVDCHQSGPSLATSAAVCWSQTREKAAVNGN
jgi:hypothetical protein